MSTLDAILGEVVRGLHLAKVNALHPPWAVRITQDELEAMQALVAFPTNIVQSGEDGTLLFYGVQAVVTTEEPPPGTRLVWPENLYQETG